jgi:hypothetical protein
MSTSDRTSKTTIERRFDVMIDITNEWFRSYVSELAKYGGDDPDDVNCDVRLDPDFDSRVVFYNRKAWMDHVLTNWTEVTETNISQYGGVVRRALCDHRRHHVVLSVEANSTAEIERAFALLCVALSLRASPQEPYRYRRSSLEFEVGNWRPDLFVVGIKGIAALLGTDPDVPEAYAKSFEGDIEKLTPFFNLKSFCDGVGMRASRFGEVVIRMHARSISIGIGVTSDHKKLRIRTSLPPDGVDKIISAWPEELKLKPIKAVDTGANVGGVAPGPSENPWPKYGLPVVVAFITAISTAGIVSLKKAVWPDYRVIITSPTVANGVARWSGNAVTIDWYLQPDQPSLRALNKDVVATVRLHASSGPQSAVESKPPVSLALTPGNYVVLVDAPGAAPAQFQLMVEKPPRQPDQQRP